MTRLPLLNRAGEIDRLRALLGSPDGRFGVVYGRRRCGKSRLLWEVLPPGQAVYYVGDDRESALQRSDLAAAVGRGRDDTDLARAFAATLTDLAHVVWVPLDRTLAEQAAGVAAQHRLRGSDAVYAAVALRFGSSLITLDREQRARLADAVTARYPTEALAAMGLAPAGEEGER